MKRKIIVLVVMAALLISTTCYATFAGSEPKARPAFEKTDSSTGKVNVSVLNLREGPSTDYPTIGKLSRGQVLTVMGKLGDWYAVYDPDTGRVGAVYGKYLNVDDVAVPVSANVAEKKDKDKEKEKEKTTSPSSGKIVLTEDEQKLLELVNKAREENGLEPLAIDENLMRVARIKAKDMVENNYFSHQSPTYGSPFDMMRQFDNTFKSAGENIAGNKTVEGAFKAWMSSETHKKNILNPGFKVTGIGIENSPTYGKILVQQFIGR
ncbi:MAG TPA: CAP domain-containing protein [Clostridiales bacterium]|nr:CAP domain-containing protein [Clostridiales bacterium]HPV02451.1 CAP domain-containing protein [Clostridiales bacterium]